MTDNFQFETEFIVFSCGLISVLPSRPVILSANPSSDSVTVVHPNSGDADLGQVELDLEKTCSETDNLFTAQTTLDLGVEVGINI